jgi:hypothetical protein
MIRDVLSAPRGGRRLHDKFGGEEAFLAAQRSFHKRREERDSSAGLSTNMENFIGLRDRCPIESEEFIRLANHCFGPMIAKRLTFQPSRSSVRRR